MNNQYKLISSIAGYPANMALFKPPVSDMLGNNIETVIFSTKNPLDDSRFIFEITGNRNQLIYAKGMTLHMKAKIVQIENNDPVPEMPAGLWNPVVIAAKETDTNAVKELAATNEAARQLSQQAFINSDVFPVNNIYHSMFKDATISIQGVPF